MSALSAVMPAYHLSQSSGPVCAYARGEGALAVVPAPPEAPAPVGVPVMSLRVPNREQIRYSLGAGLAPNLVLRGPEAAGGSSQHGPNKLSDT